MSARPEATAEPPAEAAPAAGPGAIPDTLDFNKDFYDLEEEMLEEDPLAEPERFEGEIEPVTPDTFAVEDTAAPEADATGYDLGYRIQVLATGDLAKAKAFKAQAAELTGLAAYIEMEGGLYKVRLGDFAGREEAGSARAIVSEQYPDCWIVSTTVKKTR